MDSELVTGTTVGVVGLPGALSILGMCSGPLVPFCTGCLVGKYCSTLLRGVVGT